MNRPGAGAFSLMEWAAIVSIILVWGVNNAAAKVATAVLPPLFVGGARFVLALVCLSPFLKPPFPPWRKAAPIMLLTGPMHFALVYLAFSIAHSFSPLVIALQLWIPFTAVFAWRVLGETMRPAAVVGLVVAFGGVAGMSLDPAALHDWPAIAICAAASALWGLGTVLMRRSPDLKPMRVQALTALVTAPTLMGASLAFEPRALTAAAHAPAIVWGAIAWGGCVSTLGATGALFWLIQRREAGRVTPYFLVTPLVSCSIGVFFMGDHISPQVALGGLATLAGVAIVSLSERRETAATVAPEPA